VGWNDCLGRVPAGMAPDGHPRAKTRRAGNHDIADDAVAVENVVAGTLTELRPPDPIGPCDDREEKRATYGHDMNDDYLIWAALPGSRVPRLTGQIQSAEVGGAGLLFSSNRWRVSQLLGTARQTPS
jgi:hypothetical protein